MNKLGGSTLLFVLATLAMACGDNDTDAAANVDVGAGEEQDLTEAPYLELVKTDDAQGSKIVAHGFPAVATTADGLVKAALLLETPSSAAGYTSFQYDERAGMGSFTGSTVPLISVDARTSTPKVTLHQNFVDYANAQLKEEHWSHFVEHTATNNAVTTGYGWTITYEPKPAGSSYPKLHVQRNGADVLTKGAGYWRDNAFGPTGCSYVPELASAAVSTQHKALLMRVHFNTSDAACSITDRYFTEALP